MVALALWSGLGLALAVATLVGLRAEPALWTAFDGSALALALPLAAASYLLRFARWHRLIGRVAPGLDRATSFRAQAAGFGLTVTPARLGEITKFYLLEQQTGQPAARTTPVMFIEKLTEGVSFLLLALGAGLVVAPAWALGASARGWPLALGLVAVAALAAGAVFLRRRLSGQIDRFATGPGGLRRWLGEFAHGSWRVIGVRPLAEALFLSVLARVCDALVLFALMRGLGLGLGAPVAIFVLGAAGLAGGLSMLPGGVGAVEASMAGLLVAFGAPGDLAIGAALLTRAFTLWLWVAVGLLVLVKAPLRPGGVSRTLASSLRGRGGPAAPPEEPVILGGAPVIRSGAKDLRAGGTPARRSFAPLRMTGALRVKRRRR
jgi:uncharacterized protein (TIRG00374 family)